VEPHSGGLVYALRAGGRIGPDKDGTLVLLNWWRRISSLFRADRLRQSRKVRFAISFSIRWLGQRCDFHVGQGCESNRCRFLGMDDQSYGDSLVRPPLATNGSKKYNLVVGPFLLDRISRR